MAFHDNTRLNAAFSTTHGAAVAGTIDEPERENYSAAGIIDHGVEVNDEHNGIIIRSTTVEFRKADLADPDAGLRRGTTFLVGEKTYHIEELLSESTYTLTYYCTK